MWAFGVWPTVLAINTIKYSTDGEELWVARYMGEEIASIQADQSSLPQNYHLAQNYPNPFNPVTTIQYELPERSDVKILIYDLLGRKVTKLLSEKQDAGYKSIIWNATNDQGKPSAPEFIYTRYRQVSLYRPGRWFCSNNPSSINKSKEWLTYSLPLFLLQDHFADLVLKSVQ